MSPEDVARALVGRSVAVRKNDQQIDFPVLLFGALLVIGVPYGWMSLMTNRLDSQSQSQYARATARALGSNVYENYSEPTQTPFNFGAVLVSTPTPTLGVQPTYTLYPTYTPYPTLTPSVDWLRGTPPPTENNFHASQVNWVFSYYYPDLVGVDVGKYGANCHPDNYRWNEPHTKVIGCKDTTASGEKWSEWTLGKAVDSDYRGGIAVPFHPDTCPKIQEGIVSASCKPLYPFGTTLRVVSPSSIAGDYVVVDICPACGNYIYSHGVLFLDFIAEGMPDALNFWDDVNISDVIYP